MTGDKEPLPRSPGQRWEGPRSSPAPQDAPELCQESQADPRLCLSGLSCPPQYCTVGKPSQGQSLFSLNIKHSPSLYLFLWTIQQTSLMYKLPQVQSPCVWFISTARLRAQHQVSGSGWSKGCQSPHTPQQGARGTRGHLGQPVTKPGPAIHPSLGHFSQTSDLGRYHRFPWLFQTRPV